MKLTVSLRILLGFALGISALVIVVLIACFSIAKIHADALENIQAREYRREFAGAWEAHLTWGSKVANTLLNPKAQSLEVALDPRQCAFGKWYYSEKRQEAERFAPQIREPLASLEIPHNQLHETGKKISDLLAKGDRKEAIALYLGTAVPIEEQMDGAFKRLYVDVTKHVTSDADLASYVRSKKKTIALAGLILSVVMVLMALYLRKNIRSILQKTINVLTTTATEIAATVTQHEHSATEQAVMATETSTTVNELDASARQTAEQASSTVEVAQRASALTEEGNQAVVQAIEGMTSLKDKVGVVAEQILRLGEQTSQIGNIANLVKDLATQTNMLALNAAVEAARAGEHGKGFAVVASEVRKLADQSKKSAEEASSLIVDIQTATNSTIMVTEEGSKTVEEVTRSAHKVGELFENLAGEANRVYENAQQVVLNAKQQSAAINQIIEAINNVNVKSKETATGISQTKVGIQSLEEAAQNLQAMV